MSTHAGAQLRSESIDWHKADIKAALEKEGLTLTQIAKKNQLGSSTIYNVFHRPYPRVEKMIADYIGVSPQEIWPSRYMQKRVA